MTSSTHQYNTYYHKLSTQTTGYL